MPYDKQTQEDMFSKIALWKESGLSQKAYCQQNNIRYYVFHYWYKRYRDQQSAVKENTFVPLNVKPSTVSLSSSAIEILLPDGKRILFHQPVGPDYLKALIS
ncbi:MAG: putative transposase [Segetibacter sp.]|nr:putative transposase [Segetibacter sp.]